MGYTPIGESARDLWLERSYFVGGFLGAVAYGFHCCVYAATVYFLVCRPLGTREHRARNLKSIAFVSVLWLVATINLAAGIQWNKTMFIENRNYPGGPAGFMRHEYDDPIDTLGNTTYVINNCLTDLMVLYRAFVIWGYNYWVVLIPFLAIIASTILSLFTVLQAAIPNATIWTHITFSFAVPYWSLSVSISILPTLLIIFRLVFARNSLRTALGEEHAKSYTSLIAVVVESAAVYAVVGLVFIVAYWRNSYVQNLALPVMAQVMCIAPELIIIRVAFGHAFTRETAVTMSTVRFRKSLTSTRKTLKNSTPKGSTGILIATDGDTTESSGFVSVTLSSGSSNSTGSDDVLGPVSEVTAGMSRDDIQLEVV